MLKDTGRYCSENGFSIEKHNFASDYLILKANIQMKKTILNRTLFVLMLLVGTIGFASCGSDDDDKKVVDYNSISGSWQLSMGEAKMDVKGLGEVTLSFVLNKTTHTINTVAKLAGVSVPLTEKMSDALGGMFSDIIFTANKAYTVYEYDNGKRQVLSSGKYELKGDVLTMYDANNVTENFKVGMKDDKHLTFTVLDGEITQTFKSMTFVLER